MIQIKTRAFYNMWCHFVSVILFAHSLTSVTSLDPFLYHPCLPASLVYLSVVPSFTSFPNCLPYPFLPFSPLPYFVSVILFAPLPKLFVWLLTLYTNILFSAFDLPYFTSVIILFSNSPTCITPPPSIPQPRLLSSLPPLFCVYDSICHPPPPV